MIAIANLFLCFEQKNSDLLSVKLVWGYVHIRPSSPIISNVRNGTVHDECPQWSWVKKLGICQSRAITLYMYYILWQIWCHGIAHKYEFVTGFCHSRYRDKNIYKYLCVPSIIIPCFGVSYPFPYTKIFLFRTCNSPSTSYLLFSY